MNWRDLKYIFYIIPILWAFIKDMVWEDLTMGEIRTNYLFGRANAYEQAGFLEKAINVYQKILERDPNSLPAYLSLGGLHYRRGMFEKAIPYYEKVIKSNSKHYQGHYWLAMCYLKLERYYAAIHTLEEVIEYLPTFKDALNLMGECYEQIGEGAKAEHFYLKAISSDPDGIIIHRRLPDPVRMEKRREDRMKH
jgi:tetratricopeptide (TPR) repeat protein